MAKDKNKRPKGIDLESDLGVSRRDLLRRGAVVGGTLLWAAPVVQSITQPAFANEQNGSVRYACCWCTRGHAKNRVYCGTLGGGSGLGSDADCSAKCTSAGFSVHEFHTSTAPFVCSGATGCRQQ